MKPADVSCLIRAAGLGSRLGLGPKAWVELAGQPLLEWALQPVRGRVGRVIVAVTPESVDAARRRWGHEAHVMAGGHSRWDTTRRLADVVDTPWVMLHDTVHPLVSVGVVADLLEAAERTGAAVPALPIEDFVWDDEDDRIRPPRHTRIIQTPVVLRRDVLRAGISLLEGNTASLGAEASVIEVLSALGQPWAFVDGDPRNLKVTHRGDLDVAAALLGS